jgi:predicted membrane-bound spermidine synthase
LLPLVFILIKNIDTHDVILFCLFASLVFIISFLTGAIFSVASKIFNGDYGTTASNAYGLDLLGAATGALLFSIYIIPLFGFGWSVLITGVFNLILVFAGPKS